MKKNSSLLAALILLIGIFHVHAGTIFYQSIPAPQSDANSGISGDNHYTSAVDGGNTKGTDRVINGITLHGMAANGLLGLYARSEILVTNDSGRYQVLRTETAASYA